MEWAGVILLHPSIQKKDSDILIVPLHRRKNESTMACVSALF